MKTRTNRRSRVDSEGSEEFADFLNWTGCSSEDALRAVLSAISPYQPGSLRQKIEGRQKEMSRALEDVPDTWGIWQMFESADFRCKECGSQLRITLDRVDPRQGYERKNLRVLCADCNRRRSRPNSSSEGSLILKVFRAVRDLLTAKPDRFPSDPEIKITAGISDLSGSLYLVNFLRHRWQMSRPIRAKAERSYGFGARNS